MMMTVPLLEDDGTTSMIEVPCTRREIKSRQISASPRPSRWIMEPLPHPEYEFLRVLGGGGSRAERKAGQIA